jgi:hypothetical protein
LYNYIKEAMPVIEFEQLMSTPSPLREPDPEIDQKGLDRYDHLMLYHPAFDDRQEFHVPMNLIMDGKIQASLRSGVNFTNFYNRVGRSPNHLPCVHLSLSRENS